MRYAGMEPPIVAAILPTGGSATVEVLHQDSNTLLTLSSDVASESVIPGVWQFNLSAVTNPPTGYAQLVVVFSHSSGEKDYSKIVVRGVMDDLYNLPMLVQANM